MAIIECLTDNPNRTFGDVRQAFTKTKCKIGTQGSVSHMFDHLAIFVFKHDDDDEDAVLEALMEADVDITDIENDAGQISVFTATSDYFKAKQTLLDSFGDIDFELDEIQFMAHAYQTLSGDDVELFEKFLAMLDELDDVQRVFHNIEQA